MITDARTFIISVKNFLYRCHTSVLNIYFLIVKQDYWEEKKIDIREKSILEKMNLKEKFRIFFFVIDSYHVNYFQRV